MVNVLIPVVKKEASYAEMIRKISQIDDVMVFVGVNQEFVDDYVQLKSQNIAIVEYDNSSDKEMIINGLGKYVGDGSIMVIREHITIADFKKFLLAKQDIVYCRKQRSKFMNMILTLWIKLLRFIIGVAIYRGDTAVVYFSENLTPVILGTQNISFASRADRWKGVDKTSIQVDCPNEKYPVDKKLVLFNILFISLALVIGITVPILVCLFANVSIIVGLLLFCLDTLCFATIFICTILVLFSLKVGKRNPNGAVELNIYAEEIDDSLDENYGQDYEYDDEDDEVDEGYEGDDYE